MMKHKVVEVGAFIDVCLDQTSFISLSRANLAVEMTKAESKCIAGKRRRSVHVSNTVIRFNRNWRTNTCSKYVLVLSYESFPVTIGLMKVQRSNLKKNSKNYGGITL